MVVVGGWSSYYCSVIGILGLELELEVLKCMRDLVFWVPCWVRDLGLRISWDSGLLIRSRGRWGKCG